MRRLFILLLVAITCLSADAQQISEQQALVKAQAFMKGKQFKPSANARSLSRARSKKTSDESLYIFNVENKGGFVIVSGDERTEPILGYSTSGEINNNNIPDNLRAWLEGYEAQIKAVADNPQLARTRKKSAGMPAIDPLIQTKWGQGSPYNLRCPEDEPDMGRTPAGCVATALAQVMYYHKWPETCTAIPGYTTSRKELVLNDLPVTSFEWEKMKLTYSYDDTGEAVDAVAKLMRYCGQAMGMDYSSEGSSTDIYEYSLINYFGYSVNTHTVMRSLYQTSEWYNMLYAELKNKRPVLYSGFSASDIENISGHQFILDGYDDGLFHVNWGWNGDCDGFFLLSILNPIGPGGDNGFAPSVYVVNQSAVLGMEPSDAPVNLLPEVKVEEVGYVNATRYRNSSNEDFGYESLSGSVSYSFVQKPDAPFNIDLGWGLFKKDGEFVSCLRYETKSLEDISGIINNNMEIWFDKTIPEGSFNAYQIYRGEGETEWRLCSGITSTILVDNYSNCLNLFSESQGSTSFTVRNFDVLGLPEPNVPLKIRLKIYTEQPSRTQRVYLWEGYEGNWKQIGLYQTYMNQGESCNVYLVYTPSPDKLGEVTLRVTYTENADYDGRDFKLQIAPLKNATVDGFNYVYNEDSKVAKLVSCSVTGRKHVSIPSYIEIGEFNPYDPDPISNSYSVEYIADGAFEGYGMTSVDLYSSNIKYIGANAFKSCPIQKVSLPWSILGIGDNAFAENNNLKTVISRNTHPFGIPDNTFDYSTNTTLYVREDETSLYESLAGWKKFTNIVGVEDLDKVVTYQIEINAENFPDENFRNYLMTDDFFMVDPQSGQPMPPGADGVFTDLEIEKIRDIRAENMNISDFTGIDKFFRLWKISCSNNNLTSLDLTPFEELTSLDCSDNKLTSLNVSSCKELEYLNCKNNLLTSLDISNLGKLINLDCTNNQITSLDVLNLGKLRDMNCNDNKLTSLDISDLNELTSLACDNNLLTSLDVSKNLLLETLTCNNNQLSALDLSDHAKLLYCYCNNNQLESLLVTGCNSMWNLSFYSNKLRDKGIDDLFETLPKVSSVSFDPDNPPQLIHDLYVIDTEDPNEGNAITPAQVEVATTKGWRVQVKSNGPYSGSDPTLYVYINEDNFPDEDFRDFLLTQWYGEDGVIKDLELPSIREIRIMGNGYIQDLTGIEHFTELEELTCRDNLMSTLDLSNNKKLKLLECSNNILKSLDLSANKELEEVILQHNKLTSIVLLEDAKIKKLDLEDNHLTSLDVTGCPVLEELSCFNNKLTELKVANCSTLEKLFCSDNKLTVLDFTGCTSLKSLGCSNNQFTELDVTKLVKLISLGCDDNQLTSLDVTTLKRLQSLNCCGNKLTSLDLSNNIALTELRCFHNRLTALDFSGCPKIKTLWMYNNCIRGEAMDALIESLPEVNDIWPVMIELTAGCGERNVITEAQVAALKEKGWVPYSYEDGVCYPYPGGETVVLKGDADNNGEVNAADIVAIVGYFAGIESDSFDFDAADANDDGKIDIADIILISYAIMSKK